MADPIHNETDFDDNEAIRKRTTRASKDLQVLFSKTAICEWNYPIIGQPVSRLHAALAVIGIPTLLEWMRPACLRDTVLERAYVGLVALLDSLAPSQRMVTYLYLPTDVIGHVPFFTCKWIASGSTSSLALVKRFLLPNSMVQVVNNALQSLRALLAKVLPEALLNLLNGIVVASDALIQLAVR